MTDTTIGTPRYLWGPSVRALRVELLGVGPVVWRRFVVPSETKLPKFNRMLEAVMGWQGYHLHMFEIADLRIGSSDEDDDDVIDERRITLKQLLPRVGSQVRWAYDFGDNWHYDVVVEAIEEPSPDVRYPMCTAGERACPPEDCGGVGGYEDLRDALADPEHSEHEWLREWAGVGFDPDAFDQTAATQRLRRVR
ncbi:MAG: plasmid pRiA4b ORF-3 family protein [Acidimicrobiales bacterium]